MNTPLKRIRRGALVLATVFVLAILGYRFLASYDWMHAVWMVVVTISSVGYGEQSQLPSHVQALSVVVIIVGMSAAVYTVGGLIQLMLEGEIQTALGQQRMRREIKGLASHVIVCGYGRIGQMLAEELRRTGHHFVVIDNDPIKINEAHQHGFLTVSGDATEEETLLAAALDRAQTLVSVLPTDAANVFITLTASNINKHIQIIARAEHPSTGKKLRQAGADRVVMPAVTGATQMARMITRPSTADVMELLAQSSFMDLEMDEIRVGEASQFAAVTVLETNARKKHGLLIVAVKKPDGNMIFNPDTTHIFGVEDTVIVMGRTSDIENFRSECTIAAT